MHGFNEEIGNSSTLFRPSWYSHTARAKVNKPVSGQPFLSVLDPLLFGHTGGDLYGIPSTVLLQVLSVLPFSLVLAFVALFRIRGSVPLRYRSGSGSCLVTFKIPIKKIFFAYYFLKVQASPPFPCIWAHIRGRYWSAKIDYISL